MYDQGDLYVIVEEVIREAKNLLTSLTSLNDSASK